MFDSFTSKIGKRALDRYSKEFPHFPHLMVGVLHNILAQHATVLLQDRQWIMQVKASNEILAATTLNIAKQGWITEMSGLYSIQSNNISHYRFAPDLWKLFDPNDASKHGQNEERPAEQNGDPEKTKRARGNTATPDTGSSLSEV